MVAGTETLYIGEGNLNALVIHRAGEAGRTEPLCRIVAGMVESRGSLPMPAETALKVEQDVTLREVTEDALHAVHEACTEDGASYSSEFGRCGDAAQDVRLRLTCSRGESCCQAGLAASRLAILDQCETAQRQIKVAPLLPFQLTNPRRH